MPGWQSTQWVATARMLPRAGFGVSGPEVDAAVSRDWPGYVDAMLSTNPDADPGAIATPMPGLEPLRANVSQGTDHGTAGPVFLAGVPVKGGFYGEEPSLTDLDNGDLKFTTDFRDIYYELLSRTIGTDPTPSVGAGRTSLGFL